MIASLIGALLVAVGVIVTALFQKVNGIKKENQVFKAKEVTHEAEVIVAKKSDDELITDFNSRYKPDGSGGGPS